MRCVERVFHATGFRLETGRAVDLALRYRVHGAEGSAAKPLILVPHHYSASPASMDAMIGAGRPLDPTRYCVVCPAQVGPSSFTAEHQSENPARDVSITEDVRIQRALVAEVFPGRPVALVVGFSMGALQALEWAVQAPSSVARIVAIAGCAVTPPHSMPLLDALSECLRIVSQSGATSTVAEAAIRTHAKVLAAAAIPTDALRERRWRVLGYETIDDFIDSALVGGRDGLPAQELLCQLAKWKAHDVSARLDCGLDAALGRIRARTRLIALQGDRFFPRVDMADDQRRIAGSDLAVIDSGWGHFGFTSFRPKTSAALDRHVAEMLGRPAPSGLESVTCA